MKRGMVAAALLGAGLLLAGCRPTGYGMPGPAGGQFTSNGQRIYYTATSDRGNVITAQWSGGGGMMGRSTAPPCVRCHGQDGRGGRIFIMMRTIEAADIRYKTLTLAMGDEPPFTDDTIKRAITQGLDSAGQPLDPNMPRWSMVDRDLGDLVLYLRTL